MEQKKYSIIYADPPWTFRVYSPKGNGRSAAIHYPTMNLEAIKDLPVEQLADTACTLFLWVTFPNLRESFEVIRSWGFTFKTVAFVWIKQNRKSESLFWILDSCKCGDLPSRNERLSKAAVCRCSSGDNFPCRGTQ